MLLLIKLPVMRHSSLYLQACENCFQRGDLVFKEEHRRYMELLGQMEKEGYTVAQLENLQEEFKRRISIIQHKEKENAREGRIASRIYRRTGT